ncbi:MAG: Uridine phosphorylase [Caldanaerobacter subterraneus]|uniref:Uridine phosphorylase n=1 Tax=Caldanaerobacter subterraneus TaxID=911092 RepID=A0A117KVM6_9THEO|nr:nucleoside phosphorylase [Caldanaerobacter subterraneus]KUK08468.1 MAG: Uridine phosphorylase [Caldanaerobacter subterraneus]HBT48516.1 uridine phosphorylase [Caldanaerobacter subterraneus]
MRDKQEAKIPDFKQGEIPTFIKVEPEKVSRYVILAVKDPLAFEEDAASLIAKYCNQWDKIGDSGMYITYNGVYKDIPITVCFTGTGAPDTELAFMEFALYTKADTFIRVGTSGSYQPEVNIGDVVITYAAVRDEGASKEYVKENFPAIANYEVVTALLKAAETLNVPYHFGITRSCDTMFCGLGRPGYKGYIQEEHKGIVQYWHNAGVLNVEREASIILTLSTLFGLRGGAVCSVVDSYLTGDIEIGAGIEKAVKVALEGIYYLAQIDDQKAHSEKKYWVPSI